MSVDQVSCPYPKRWKCYVTVVPSITEFHLEQKIIEFLNKGFSADKLADLLPCQEELSAIEMLIENDYYFELFQPRKIDLGESLFPFYSKLDWILSGQVHSNTEESSEPSLLVSTIGSVWESTHMLTSIDLSLEPQPNA